MPAVARKGDREICHCSVPKRQGAFGSVYANGKRMSGQGHKNTMHLKPCACPKCCCMHSVILKRGSPNVYAEGISIGRVGDPTCTAVAQGSPNVFANGGSGTGAAGIAAGMLSTTNIVREEAIYDMGST